MKNSNFMYKKAHSSNQNLAVLIRTKGLLPFVPLHFISAMTLIFLLYNLLLWSTPNNLSRQASKTSPPLEDHKLTH